MFKVDIKSDLKEWNALVKRLENLSSLDLQVGFFEDAKYGSENNNLHVATVASWQEQGNPVFNVNYPARPFMRVGLRDSLRRGGYKNEMAQVFTNVMIRKKSSQKELSQLGDKLATELSNIIYAWDTPPNSPSTVDQKGFNDPLVETGTMAESTDYKVVKSRGKQ